MVPVHSTPLRLLSARLVPCAVEINCKDAMPQYQCLPRGHPNSLQLSQKLNQRWLAYRHFHQANSSGAVVLDWKVVYDKYTLTKYTYVQLCAVVQCIQSQYINVNPTQGPLCLYYVCVSFQACGIAKLCRIIISIHFLLNSLYNQLQEVVMKRIDVCTSGLCEED